MVNLVDKQLTSRSGSVPIQIESRTVQATTAFISALLIMLWILYSLPPLATIEGGKNFVWRPFKVEHFRMDTELMARYRDAHAWRLLLGMSVTYILLQTFCIPGSGTTLNVLAGCLYKEYTAFGEYLIAWPFSVLCSTGGAVMCYLLSYITCREFVARRWPARVAWLRHQITELDPPARVFYFISLRLSPLCPAWFLNLAAPVTPLSLGQFALGTLVGCTPSSFLAVTAGATLSELRPGDDVAGAALPSLLALCAVAAAVALLPRALRAARILGPAPAGPGASGSWPEEGEETKESV